MKPPTSFIASYPVTAPYVLMISPYKLLINYQIVQPKPSSSEISREISHQNIQIQDFVQPKPTKEANITWHLPHTQGMLPAGCPSHGRFRGTRHQGLEEGEGPGRR
jgi:hypothetical protein